MIPWVVAHELRETLLDYLQSTWSLSDREFEAVLFAFLRSEGGLFQGPYLRIGLPFAPSPHGVPVPLDVAPSYVPHLHQLQAWQRLSSKGQEPRATLITTGTGSGKTECFLYPLLDHALREARAGKKGIKAIILYPMNALASDQAGRFAATIHHDPALRDWVKVGLFVGGEGRNRTMGSDHVIDENDHLRRHPPDILLTNYRMLDLLLQRPKDAPLWADNAPDTLRYVVLDELHTYDGAQGTDVACLLRRLGQRLGSSERICPVGTSATVGSGDSTRAELLRFASTLFDQTFEEDAFIGETRIEPQELFDGDPLPERYPAEPGPWPEPGERAHEHVTNVARAWLPDLDTSASLDRVALARRTLHLPIVRALLTRASAQPLSREATMAALADELPLFASLEGAAQAANLAAALSLISYGERLAGDKPLPLVQVQTTLWVREIRRLLARVGGVPAFRFHDESPAPPDELWLPRYACRDCGHGGWLTTESGPSDKVADDYRDIARAYRETTPALRLLWAPIDGDGEGETARKAYVSAQTRRLLDKPIEGLDLPVVCVSKPDEGKLHCPGCHARDSLLMVAARSTSLSSVAIGHLFTTPLNTDRKLLTFSDSVQDAAHRAGFFGARTYRFALRSALLAAVPNEGEIALSELGPATWTHWAGRLGRVGLSAEAELAALLLPVDLHYLSSAEDWHDRLEEFTKAARQATEAGEHSNVDVPDPGEGLVTDLKKRLTWEATRELGLASRIGRTLEQSGCVGVTVHRDPFDAAVTELCAMLREKVGLGMEPQREHAGPDAVRAFVAGLLNRMRLRGAIADPLIEPFVATGGNAFMLSKEKAPLLSPFGRATNRPIWLTNARRPRHFDTFESAHRTWLVDWVDRTLGRPATEAAAVYRVVLPVLTKHGLLVEVTTEEQGVLQGARASAWGLSPGALRVSRNAAVRRCEHCGLELPVVHGSPTDVLDQPCPRFRCAGRMRAVGPPQTDAVGLPVATYYKRFYERGELGRLWSREHTGLLEREAREDLELEFKSRPRPDSPNLLSCTPTLEMGIDIGDLSATLLCSVPPSSANYVQRVGRAGRKTGNALVLAFAATRPHDLYFFQQPLEAMAGAIHPPGCYLSAPEVLKRQALAFCFDSYARAGGKTPGRVSDLLHGEEAKRFPAPLLAHLSGQRTKLGDRFVELFRGAELSVEARATARRFFEPAGGAERSPVEQVLVDAVEGVRARRDELTALIKKVDARRKELGPPDAPVAAELGPKDEIEAERGRLRDERAFLWKQHKSLTERDFFGWLTEEGCLPNYAFPERGVRLEAHVRREGTAREPEHHSWVRPPAAALTELAPFNTFYASARRVRIDGVAVKKDSAITVWAFCRRCHDARPTVEVADGATTCPSCGDDRWADVGLRRKVLQLTESFAVTQHRDAVVGDDGDDRDRMYYERITLFQADKQAREAWANEKAGFGFELQSRLVMRQLNLGLQQESVSSSLLAGKAVPDVNFLVCAECGQAQPPPIGGNAAPHAPHRGWCPERKKPAATQKLTPVHLMREITSEALRLVLPLSSSASVDADTVNLRAALRLGLRKLHGGEPDFLEVQAYDEPLASGEGRRRMLLVLDRVPGGTGMLAELAVNRGAKLRIAFERAREVLATCACRKRDPKARACYQCLYAYREGDDLPKLDREQARVLCDRVLDAFDALNRVDGVGTMSQSEVLESELEYRFVAALGERVRALGGAMQEKVEGEWTLRLGTRGWAMRAQVELGQDRVAVPCRADFVLFPEESAGGERPVAVFTDGLAFHVQPGGPRGRLYDDARKRAGISASGDMLSWSLAWKDVVTDGAPGLPRWIGDESTAAKLRALATAMDTHAKGGLLETALPVALEDPLAGLCAYLQAPSRMGSLAALTALVLLTKGTRRTAEEVAEAQTSARRDPSPQGIVWSEPVGDQAVARVDLGEHAVLMCDAPSASLKNLAELEGKLRVTLRLEDVGTRRSHPSFEGSWRRWLHAWNLLQALPDAALVTREGLDDHGVSVATPPARPKGPPAAEDPRLAIVEEIQDEGLRFALRDLLIAHPDLEAPQVPFELRRPSWETDDDVEIAWPERKVAIHYDAQRAQADLLRRAGWTTLPIERADTRVALVEALGLKEHR